MRDNGDNLQRPVGGTTRYDVMAVFKIKVTLTLIYSEFFNENVKKNPEKSYFMIL